VLEFAIACDRAAAGPDAPSELAWAVLDSGLGLRTTDLRISTGDVPYQPRYRRSDVARLLLATRLVPAEGELLTAALRGTVGAAMYWQPPDATDQLIAAADLREALRPIAEHLVSFPAVQDGDRRLRRDDQWLLHWREAGPPSRPPSLARWREDIQQANERAERDRQLYPEENWSGEWWSAPPSGLANTTPRLGGGCPAGLVLIEDELGWRHARAQQVVPDESARIYEISSPDDWAHLCAQFPLEVTGRVGADWRQVTGQSRDWVIPDWSQVATDFDGVHLSVGGYLRSATRVIEVGGAASMIAGWSPDVTWWLNNTFTLVGEPELWHHSLDGLPVPG
jgi:hypothetical protein